MSEIEECNEKKKIGENKVILIDMDNTLVDWDYQFSKLMSEMYPNIAVVPMNRRIYWEIELNYPTEFWKEITTLNAQQNFWLGMRPMECGIEALKEMDECGYCVYIVSSPDIVYTSECAKEKYLWVEKHLGPKWKNRVILTSDKTLIRGDILLDDKPTASIGAMKPTWKHILFSHAYNEMYVSQVHLKNWKDWKAAFKQLELQQLSNPFNSSEETNNEIKENGNEKIE